MPGVRVSVSWTREVSHVKSQFNEQARKSHAKLQGGARGVPRVLTISPQRSLDLTISPQRPPSGAGERGEGGGVRQGDVNLKP